MHKSGVLDTFLFFALRITQINLNAIYQKGLISKLNNMVLQPISQNSILKQIHYIIGEENKIRNVTCLQGY